MSLKAAQLASQAESQQAGVGALSLTCNAVSHQLSDLDLDHVLQGADQPAAKGLPQLTRRPSTASSTPTPGPSASTFTDNTAVVDKPAATSQSRGTGEAGNAVKQGTEKQTGTDAQTSGGKHAGSVKQAGASQNGSVQQESKEAKPNREEQAQSQAQATSRQGASADEITDRQAEQSQNQGADEEGKEGKGQSQAADDEGGLPKPATGQEEEEGAEALGKTSAASMCLYQACAPCLLCTALTSATSKCPTMLSGQT